MIHKNILSKERVFTKIIKCDIDKKYLKNKCTNYFNIRKKIIVILIK